MRHTMSVELREEVDGKVLILNPSGKLTKEDYAHFTPAVEGAVKAYGKIRFPVRMHGFHGWTLRAMWEDVKFDLHHFSHIERFALVGDRKWEVGSGDGGVRQTVHDGRGPVLRR
jgi:hypothetical protein